MRAAGYTAVGEFHYLGAAEALRRRGGRGRRRDRDRAASTSPTSAAASTGCASRPSPPTSTRSRRCAAAGIAVGVAPHSVRACSRDWLEEIGRVRGSESGCPLHVHADEQPREIEECLEEHGCRPIELLADTGCLGDRTTVVHATHANDDELDLLAAARGDDLRLPDDRGRPRRRLPPRRGGRDRSIPLCIGSDSNMRIDPLEELRELEGIARRQTGRRGILSTGRAARRSAAREERAHCSSTSWATIEIDLGHRSLAGVAPSTSRGAHRRLRGRRRRSRGA